MCDLLLYFQPALVAAELHDLGLLGGRETLAHAVVGVDWRIQRRTDSGDTSKSAATSAMLRSPLRATLATSRLNSSGNFSARGTSFRGAAVRHTWDVNRTCSRP